MPSKEQTPPINGDVYSVGRVARYIEQSAVTPNFRELKSQGADLPVQPYYWHNTVFTGSVVTRGSLQRNCFPGVLTGEGTLKDKALWHGGSMFDRDVITPFRNSITNALFREILDTNVDALAFVKEFPQTCQLAVSAMRTARDLYRGLVRRAPDYAVDALLHGRGHSERSARRSFGSAVSSRWLEVSYGVKPLLQDVQGACTTLQSLLTPPNREIKAKIGWTQNETGKSESGTSTSAIQRSSRGHFEIKMKAELVYRVDDPWTVAYQALGLDRPLASLWECIPYSFVVDWFLDVSGWLNSGRSIQGCTFVRGFRSERIKGLVLNMERASGKTAFGTSRTLDKRRVPLNGFPSTVETPIWSPYFSASRVANAAALLWQGFDRRRGKDLDSDPYNTDYTE